MNDASATTTRYCGGCGLPLDVHDGSDRLCLSCQTLATDPSALCDETGSTEDTRPGRDVIEDPEHQLMVRRVERGFDVRWEAREQALIEQMKSAVAIAVSEQLEPVHRRLDRMESEMQLTRKAAERAASQAIDGTTLRRQVVEILDRCAREHGPFGSVPPEHGNGASVPPVR